MAKKYSLSNNASIKVHSSAQALYTLTFPLKLSATVPRFYYHTAGIADSCIWPVMGILQAAHDQH
eukprot:1161612-Ditylum_brightwellii.AAC.1